MAKMSRTKVLLLSLLLVIYTGPRGNCEEIITVATRDFLDSFQQPSLVTALACSNFEYFSLAKKFSTNNIRIAIKRTNRDLLPLIYPSNMAVYLLNLQCEFAIDIIIQANRQKLFSAPYKWIIFARNKENLTNYFWNISILVDSSINIFQRVDSSLSLFKIYKLRENFELIYENIGTWNEEEGLILTENLKYWSRKRKNLMKTTLVNCMVVTHNDTLNHLTDRRDKHIDTITKVNYVLGEHLKDIINATYNYTVENTWGYKGNNSQWNGMTGELQRLQADIGGTPLFLTADRVKVIDYIAMTTLTRSKFVFRQPKLSFVSNVYILPFHWSVWISTIFLIITITICLFIAMKWEWQKNKFENNLHDLENNKELQDSLLEVLTVSIGAICQQGSSSIPNSIPGRIVTIILFLSLIALFTSYSANIVALLQSSSNSINTLKDLLHSRLDVGVDDTVFNRFYFPNASEPIRRKIYLEKVAPPGQKPKFYSITDGVNKMRKGLFAFHMETGAGYKIVVETFEEHEKCGLQEIQFLQVSDPWLAVQKNTSFKEIFKIGLKQIQESGLQSREHSLLYTKRPQCISRGNSFISVGIVDCYFVSSIFVGGLVLAFAIFICEHLIAYGYRYQQVKRFATEENCTPVK